MTDETIFNAADEDQVKGRKRKDRRIRERELADIKAIMSAVEGRRYMWKLLDRAGIYRSSFTGNSTTFFNEGQRNLGLSVLADINESCPELYLTMLEENRKEPNV